MYFNNSIQFNFNFNFLFWFSFFMVDTINIPHCYFKSSSYSKSLILILHFGQIPYICPAYSILELVSNGFLTWEVINLPHESQFE